MTALEIIGKEAANTDLRHVAGILGIDEHIDGSLAWRDCHLVPPEAGEFERAATTFVHQ